MKSSSIALPWQIANFSCTGEHSMNANVDTAAKLVCGGSAQTRSVDGVTWCLYIPNCDDLLTIEFRFLSELLQCSAIAQGFSVVLERVDDNLRFLQGYVDSAIAQPQMYLEELRYGSSASVGYWLGDEIRPALEARVLALSNWA
jgi:hypothetical protein